MHRVPASDWLAANDLAFAVRDRTSTVPGRVAVTTRRPVRTWWDATADEQSAIFALSEIVKRRLDVEFRPVGYTVRLDTTVVGERRLRLHISPQSGHVNGPSATARAPDNSTNSAPETWPPMSPAEPSLVTPADGRFRLELLRCLIRDDLDRIDLLVSFLMGSGVDIVAGRVDDALARGARIRILTTDYLQITDSAALGFFLDRAETAVVPGLLEVRVFSDPTTSFHPKAYIFHSTESDDGVAFVGSSNLSRSGIELGVEWNMETRHIPPLRHEFAELWDDPRAVPLTREWLDDYERVRRRRLDRMQRAAPDAEEAGDELLLAADTEGPPAPIGVQPEALAALSATRIEGNAAGLVVLATGLGKTWLAAFDSTRPEFRRVLFIAHREEILDQARDVYRRIQPTGSFGRFAGGEHDLDGDVVFAGIQSLHRHLDRITPDTFDYVIVDEFHHAAAPTYRRVIGHLRPHFLLGLTATPNRADAADLLALCSDNLVYDCGLVDGVRRGLLSTFSYRAIPDVVDYENIPWRNRRFDPDELSRRLETRQRAEQVHAEWLALGGARRRTLGFCSSITHAEFMADWFRRQGVDALAVHSGPASAPRAETLERFRAGEIPVLFTVDLFNEGVDVPDLDVVLLLRPTESPIVFFQQIGRGLRRADGKERLDVLDLVGNHRAFLLKAQLLASLTGAKPGSNQAAVDLPTHGVPDLPDGCSIVVEPEAIDLLRELAGRTTPTERLAAQIDAWRTAHDEERRPTALELALHTGTPQDLRKSGGWFGALARLGELGTDEAAVYEHLADFFDYIEHGAYTKSYKLITLQVLAEASACWNGLPITGLAQTARWVIERDARLRQDLVDAGFATPSRPTVAEWDTYWRKNPIRSLTRPGRGHDTAWFTIDDDRLHANVDLPPELRDTAHEMLLELVEHRLHRYLVGRATKRSVELRSPRDATGHEIDATFEIEHEADAPIALLWQSAGGTKGSKNARNLDYVQGLDLVLQRMRTLGLVIEDAYVASTRTTDLPIPDRRLDPGDGVAYPVELPAIDDLIGLRRALLSSMRTVGRAPGVKKAGGNNRKAMRLVFSGADGRSARDLADALAGTGATSVRHGHAGSGDGSA